MLLDQQIERLELFGLRFHEALTPEFLRSHCQLEWWDEYAQPAFSWFRNNLHGLNYDFHEKHGEWLSPQTLVLDLEAYDRPIKYSILAERISLMTRTRRHLKLVEEEMIVDASRRGSQTGNGWIEYRFRDELFRHEHHYGGDWLSRKTILSMADVFSNTADGFRFYGSQDTQGIQFYYMLESEQKKIYDDLALVPLSETY